MVTLQSESHPESMYWSFLQYIKDQGITKENISDYETAMITAFNSNLTVVTSVQVIEPMVNEIVRHHNIDISVDRK